MRRFFAVLILIVGNFFVYTPLFMLGGKPRIGTEDLVLGLIMLVFGLGALLGGTALWGWIRKKMVFGVSAVSVGSVLTLMSISSRQMMVSNPSFPRMALTRLLILGLTLLVLGIVLIVMQNSQSKAKEKSSSSESVNIPPRAGKAVSVEKKAATGRSYFEKDNRGTRQESESHANAYWMSRILSPKKDPFIMYSFMTEKDAREALLELSCFKEAEDSKKLICTEILTFGCYPTKEGTYEAIITGDDLSYELWEKAKESFVKHGGKPRGQGELKPEKSGVSTKKESAAQNEKVSFVREDKRTDQSGKTTIYRIYKASNATSAKEFLEQNPVTQNFYYLVVETPEGNYCRDRMGFYKE